MKTSKGICEICTQNKVLDSNGHCATCASIYLKNCPGAKAAAKQKLFKTALTAAQQFSRITYSAETQAELHKRDHYKTKVQTVIDSVGKLGETLDEHEMTALTVRCGRLTFPESWSRKVEA